MKFINRTLKQITAAVILISCNSHQNEEQNTKAVTENVIEFNYFGDSITTEGAIEANQLASQLEGKDSAMVKFVGTIDEICQKKGCWMNMDIGNNQTMKVRFKDYAFFVPKDAGGRTAYISGYVFKDTVSVAEQRHYAEDAGKSKEEIEKINKPEISLSFEANGVIIKK